MVVPAGADQVTVGAVGAVRHRPAVVVGPDQADLDVAVAGASGTTRRRPRSGNPGAPSRRTQPAGVAATGEQRDAREHAQRPEARRGRRAGGRPARPSVPAPGLPGPARGPRRRSGPACRRSRGSVSSADAPDVDDDRGVPDPGRAGSRRGTAPVGVGPRPRAAGSGQVAGVGARPRRIRRRPASTGRRGSGGSRHPASRCARLQAALPGATAGSGASPCSRKWSDPPGRSTRRTSAERLGDVGDRARG